MSEQIFEGFHNYNKDTKAIDDQREEESKKIRPKKLYTNPYEKIQTRKKIPLKIPTTNTVDPLSEVIISAQIINIIEPLSLHTLSNSEPNKNLQNLMWRYQACREIQEKGKNKKYAVMMGYAFLESLVLYKNNTSARNFFLTILENNIEPEYFENFYPKLSFYKEKNEFSESIFKLMKDKNMPFDVNSLIYEINSKHHVSKDIFSMIKEAYYKHLRDVSFYQKKELEGALDSNQINKNTFMKMCPNLANIFLNNIEVYNYAQGELHYKKYESQEGVAVKRPFSFLLVEDKAFILYKKRHAEKMNKAYYAAPSEACQKFKEMVHTAKNCKDWELLAEYLTWQKKFKYFSKQIESDVSDLSEFILQIQNQSVISKERISKVIKILSKARKINDNEEKIQQLVDNLFHKFSQFSNPGFSINDSTRITQSSPTPESAISQNSSFDSNQINPSTHGQSQFTSNNPSLEFQSHINLETSIEDQREVRKKEKEEKKNIDRRDIEEEEEEEISNFDEDEDEEDEEYETCRYHYKPQKIFQLFRLSCSHLFCKEALEVLKESKVCPSCNVPFTLEDMNKIYSFLNE